MTEIDIDYVKIFKALSDEMRLKILQEIAKHEEICVCKLMEQFAIAQSKLSYHLKLLLEASLINVKSKGKWNFYSINMETLQNILSEKMIKTLFDK